MRKSFIKCTTQKERNVGVKGRKDVNSQTIKLNMNSLWEGVRHSMRKRQLPHFPQFLWDFFFFVSPPLMRV
jgi:hypothetical protein